MTDTVQTTYSGVLGDSRCECSDPGCLCNGKCVRKATHILYRVDMEDVSGVAFCNRCGDDALDSGVFTSEAEEDDSE